MKPPATPDGAGRVFDHFDRWPLVPLEDLVKLRRALRLAHELGGPASTDELLALVDEELRHRRLPPADNPPALPITPKMAPMDTITLEYARLRSAITALLNAHDLLGVMDHGAPEDEYDPEMEEFAALMTAGETITPEVVAGVWHKWFGDSKGDSTGEPGPPTAAMAALAADLQDVQRDFVQGSPK